MSEVGRVFSSEVMVRWSDQDIYQHINHARMVTLLEEARNPWLFGGNAPTCGLAAGAVITELSVQYRRQLRHADSPLTVSMWNTEVGAALFTSRYEVRSCHSSEQDPPAVTAQTTIAAFDIAAQRPRRLTSPERRYLLDYLQRL